jgi:multidrug transporter EmrE-like cation transporter
MGLILSYLVYGLLNVAGVLLLKASITNATAAVRDANYVSPATALVTLGGMLYALSFLCWLYILARDEVSRAYPIAIGISMVLTTAGAVALLGERLTVMHLLGITAIFVGVAVLARA